MKLTADNITFAYGRDPVLCDVSLAVESGQILALLGPNGSGKSTLLQILLGQLDRHANVAWDDKPIRDWPLRARARALAYLPQTPTYEDDQRVAEVLAQGRAPYWGAFGLESTQDQRVVHAVAEELKLNDLSDRPMSSLSGGQRQGVVLGRCLAQQPRAMLLDEPSTFLDLKHQVWLYQSLRTFARRDGMTIVLASHDLNLATAFADRVALLDSGKIAAQGTPGDVMQTELLSRVYGVEMKRVESAPSPLLFPTFLV